MNGRLLLENIHLFGKDKCIWKWKDLFQSFHILKKNKKNQKDGKKL